MNIVKPEVNLIGSMVPEGIDKDLEKFVVSLARSTRETLPISDICDQTNYINHVDNLNQYLSKGHYTVFEYIQFIFEIKGISRACSHELVRHRTASYLQQSQRWVIPSANGIVVPSSIIEKGLGMEYKVAIAEMMKTHQSMIDSGIPKEDARFILPNATPTRVIMRIDGRNLMHFLKLRLDKSAQWEIREVAELMRKLAEEKCPNIFGLDKMKYWW